MRFSLRTLIRRVLCLTVTLCLLLSSAASAAGYATLAFGSRGTAVQKLQQALLTLGYDPGGTDGKFGRGTESAVILYQTAKGLTADGKAGTQTQTMIYADLTTLQNAASTSGATSAVSTSTLRPGDTGERVRALQQALLSLGYNTNGIDGTYGPGTKKAVIAFQKAHKLTADGLAGTQTLNLVFSLSAQTSTDSDNSSGSSVISSSFSRTLRKGCTGEDVRAVQSRLTTLKYYSGSLDGVYGTGTIAAVTQFQMKNNLLADGLTGQLTYNAMFSVTAVAASGVLDVTGSTGETNSSDSAAGSLFAKLELGSTGAAVLRLQNALKALGYPVTADGAYGEQTKNAVMLFQARNGLSADGVAGTDTQTLLYSGTALAADAASVNPESDTGSSVDTAPVETSVYPTLQYGSTGAAVKKLQNALKELQYNVTADGNFGALTKTAVTAFQRRNGLTADGVAGESTQTLLYSGHALAADPNETAIDEGLPQGTGTASGPSVSQVKLLHWYNEVKPSIRTGQTITIFDPATSLQWTLRLYSLGHHADSEPLTLTDTQIMFRAFGNTNTWTPKPVYVKLPSGTWTLATMHNVPHLTGSISTNGFDGHLCVHFLRDMDECRQNDPNYGVTHQNAIRKKWKQMTGITVE